jgi:hypothetical protein
MEGTRLDVLVVNTVRAGQRRLKVEKTALESGVFGYGLGDDVNVDRGGWCVVGVGDPIDYGGFFFGGQAALFNEAVC